MMHIENDREIVRLPSVGRLRRITFSSDERFLITLADDGTKSAARFWRWRTEDLKEHACRRLSRNFTLGEWLKHFGRTPYQLVCKHLPPHGSVVNYALTLARLGLADEAAALLAHAESLGANVGPPVRRRLRDAQVRALITRSVELVARGLVDQGVRALADAKELDPDLQLRASNANNICWHGARHRQAAKVMAYCDHAVKVGKGRHLHQIHDSRGLARALSGDIAGAIEDFELFAAATKNEGESDVRRKWIAKLRKGESPFDDRTLGALK